jgi:hypothetical protein
MARIDDYKQAKALAIETLENVPLAEISQRSGFKSTTVDQLRIPFLSRVYRVSYPDFDFTDEADTAQEIPLQEQVLIMHFLMVEGPPSLSSRWVAYREIPGASFYFSAFVKRAVDPLKQVFGNNLAGLIEAAALLDGAAIEAGDAGFEFELLPGIPLQLILWEGDDEFAPEANILFDASIGKQLSPEDIAWLASLLVYRLIALSKVPKSG